MWDVMRSRLDGNLQATVKPCAALPEIARLGREACARAHV